MKAIPAVFVNGKVFFEFAWPECEGPVGVMVIFPPERELLTREEILAWLEEDASGVLAPEEVIG